MESHDSISNPSPPLTIYDLSKWLWLDHASHFILAPMYCIHVTLQLLLLHSMISCNWVHYCPDFVKEFKLLCVVIQGKITSETALPPLPSTPICAVQKALSKEVHVRAYLHVHMVRIKKKTLHTVVFSRRLFGTAAIKPCSNSAQNGTTCDKTLPQRFYSTCWLCTCDSYIQVLIVLSTLVIIAKTMLWAVPVLS